MDRPSGGSNGWCALYEARERTFTTRRFDAAGELISEHKTQILWHPCAVCGKPYAPFGFGVDMRHGKLGTWYCGEHIPAELRK